MTPEMGFIYQDVSSSHQKFQPKIFKKFPEVLPEWERFVHSEKSNTSVLYATRQSHCDTNISREDIKLCSVQKCV